MQSRAGRRERGEAAARESASVLPPKATIDRGQPIPGQVYRLLRQAIVTLRLQPGATIVEKEITDQLGISRTPVRDALRQLAEEGLVNVRRQSGTFVGLIDRQQLEEGRLIRRALEIEGVRLAATRIAERDIERLRDILALQQRAARRERHEDFIALDDEFHRSISELSGHARLWRVISGAKAQLDRVRHMSVPLPGQAQRVLVQHRAIVEALARHDPERGVKALAHHLDDAYDRLTVLLRDHAHLFR